jgi:hypothetical protein
MGIHLLRFVHGNECIGTHDVICDIFVAIAWDVGFHVGREQLHALPSIIFNPFHRRVNIVFNKDGIRTLTNVVIVDPMRANLLFQSCVIQAKEKNYRNWHPTNQFLPLAIEVFDCLDKHVNVFLHDYANAIWSLKRTKSLSSFYLGHFSS